MPVMAVDPSLSFSMLLDESLPRQRYAYVGRRGLLCLGLCGAIAAAAYFGLGGGAGGGIVGAPPSFAPAVSAQRAGPFPGESANAADAAVPSRMRGGSTSGVVVREQGGISRPAIEDAVAHSAAQQAFSARVPNITRQILGPVNASMLGLSPDVRLLPFPPPGAYVPVAARFVQGAGSVVAALEVQSARDVSDGFNAAGAWSLPPRDQGGSPDWDEFKRTFRPWVDMGSVPDPAPVGAIPPDTNGGDGTTGFSYLFIHPWDDLQVGLKGWYDGEFHDVNNAFVGTQFDPFINVGGKDALSDKPDNHYVSYAAYMMSDWQRPLAGLVPKYFNPPSLGFDGKPAPKFLTVRVRDLDFYSVVPETKLLDFNWCLVDLVSILQQGGHDLKLPPTGLYDNPAADYLPPKVMDGTPAPRRFSPLSLDDNRARRARAIVYKALAQDFCDEASVGVTEDYEEEEEEEQQEEQNGREPECAAPAMWAEDLTWYGPAGIGTAHSKKQFVDYFLKPFRAAFKGIKLNYDVLVCEGNYCAAHLHAVGTHVGEWLGEKPKDPENPKQIDVRMGLHFRVRDPMECDKDDPEKILKSIEFKGPESLKEDPCAIIDEGWSQIDLLKVLMQMGRDVMAELREQQWKEGYRLEDYQ